MFLKIITFLQLISLTCLLKAQTNSIVVFSNMGQVFNLTVNGKLINEIPQANVKARGLINGWNKLKINSLVNDKDIVLIDSFLIDEKYTNKEFTFVLNQNDTDLSFKWVAEPSGPQTPNVAVPPKIIAPLVDNSIYGNLYKAVSNKPVFFNNYDVATHTYSVILNDKDIEFGVNLIAKCNDDEQKLIYLNNIVEKNKYSTLQLSKLIEFLTIEMDRLNVCKKAFNHLTDKENAAKLANYLNYKTIKDSYTDFLKNQVNIEKQKAIQCKIAISDVAFNDLIKNIKIKPYENEKTIAAKKLLVDNCVSTKQVESILAIFTHDREKIEVLKSAYFVMVDKENAKSLVTLLSFKETRDDYLNFISNQ